ncbi:helix-turn-helix domain-containing protein [Bacillus safensis]|uniref:helix-turn-helix domain-containing protein n=1 Tax=Bacillus safensis TaxID=561879 RepID=UPI001CD6262C|nr:helix-turn-helix transcriptional regulator [Bacillus safensis]
MLGDRIRSLREKHNLTQEQIAKKIGISRGTYAHYEINKRRPDYETLIKIAEIFDVSTDYLVGRSDNQGYKIIDDNKIESDPDLQIAFNAASDFSEEARKQTIDFINYIREKEKKSGRTFKKK